MVCMTFGGARLSRHRACTCDLHLVAAISACRLSFIDFWEYITTFLTPYEPIIVMTVGGVGLGGACAALKCRTGA